MNVPFFDLRAVHLRRGPELSAAASRVLNSGWYVLGEEVRAFEKEFAAFVGAQSAVGVGTGLDALELGLRALGVGRGDGVVVPSHTFVATWIAVLRAGAELHVADVDPETWLLSPERAAAAIRPNTKAIVPVHLYGPPCDVGGLSELAAARGLIMFADAAQSHGTTYRGKPIAFYGDGAAYSFYPTKTLGVFGDGGAACFNNTQADADTRRYRSYGMPKRGTVEVLGTNSRLDELQAALARVRLAVLREEIDERIAVWSRYRERLSELEKQLTFQRVVRPEDVAWHLVVVRTLRRDDLAAFLDKRGIQTMVHYPVACHDQPAFAHLDLDPSQVREASALAREVLSLPMWPGMDLAVVDRVADAVLDFFQATA
ncbi:MAG: DegT/DnrJ/EryC1/StrS family aminotransferase [Myxococcota bacterium]